MLGSWVLLKSFKAKIALDNLTGGEDVIQDYCSRGERMNASLLKQKLGLFLSAGVS